MLLMQQKLLMGLHDKIGMFVLAIVPTEVKVNKVATYFLEWEMFLLRVRAQLFSLWLAAQHRIHSKK